MGIKIIKEKTREYTFIKEGMNLEHSAEVTHASNKNAKTQREYGPRDDAKVNNFKHRSKITGGHNKQGHSPVYE